MTKKEGRYEISGSTLIVFGICVTCASFYVQYKSELNYTIFMITGAIVSLYGLFKIGISPKKTVHKHKSSLEISSELEKQHREMVRQLEEQKRLQNQLLLQQQEMMRQRQIIESQKLRMQQEKMMQEQMRAQIIQGNHHMHSQRQMHQRSMRQ